MATRITVLGLIQDPEFQRAKFISQNLPGNFEVDSSAFVETDWELVSHRLISRFELSLVNPKVICLLNETYLGDSNKLAEWALSEMNYQENQRSEFYQEKARDEYLSYLTKSKKKYVLWGVKIGDLQERQVVIELDFGLCPKTCENFWQISMGSGQLHYRNTRFHRIVSDGYIEGGLLNRQSTSIYGGFFSDENYAYLHDKPGVLGMSKSGAHKNGSAFYITLRAMPHLNRRTVAFGRVIQGMDVIRDIAALPEQNQRPSVSCTITRCENYLSYLSVYYEVIAR